MSQPTRRPGKGEQKKAAESPSPPTKKGDASADPTPAAEAQRKPCAVHAQARHRRQYGWKQRLQFIAAFVVFMFCFQQFLDYYGPETILDSVGLKEPVRRFMRRNRDSIEKIAKGLGYMEGHEKKRFRKQRNPLQP
ncbi:hypothetical protein DIPPA_24462 [Diplonema papillatum]|nr:hypothetical protein DIPPA_24462 [Diplonema papillatum]